MSFRQSLATLLLTPSVALAGQAPRPLTVTRDVHIDAASADLTPIRGVALSPSGDLLLGQRQDQLIRVFGAAGSKPSIGRKGEGPGEFARISGIGFTRDTLWVADIANDRISFFAGPSYKFTRSVKMPVVMPFLNGVNPDIELDVQSVLPNGDLRAEANHSDYPKHLPAWFTSADTGSTVLVRTSIDGAFRKRLAVMPGSKCLVIFPIGNGRGGAEIPFCMDQLSTAASGGESVLYSSVETPGSVRVTLVNADGVTMFTRTIATTPVTIPASVRDSMTAARETARSKARRADCRGCQRYGRTPGHDVPTAISAVNTLPMLRYTTDCNGSANSVEIPRLLENANRVTTGRAKS